uniref:Flavin-containing monooxygenase n=1 Tax=Ascaris lumbricoides TaxID=6252 RepID=A0A0M3IGI3_ASCLU
MRVCVIGTGVSGLPAIKECRAAGFEVVAYERTSDIGGLWNYRPQIKDGSTLMKSTICNTSKEMMAYSDFPPSANYPNFMHNSLIRQYLQEYAENFDLLKEIRFNTSVEKGHVLHSRDYHDPQGFQNKNVFIVGSGNSAMGIAAELADVAKSVTISTRRGAWIASHLWKGGIPYDVALYNRFYSSLYNILPSTISNDYMEGHYDVSIFIRGKKRRH